MTDAILALNAGSSSIKFALAASGQADKPLLSGLAERLGTGEGTLRLNPRAGDPETRALGACDHHTALAALCDVIHDRHPDLPMTGIGHRIVHGGPDFAAPVAVTDDVLARLEALVPLAPLHQPNGIAGIRATRALFPDAGQVACLDTAFHAGKPWVHDAYALPAQYYADGLRRYGFHGLACESVCDSLTVRDYPLSERRIAIAHLGNGCSVTAVRGGRSVATSMGFSALDGLTMGTRCGHIDPGVLLHLLREGYDAASLERLLYHDSGLRGLSGISSGDMRDIAASDSDTARGAIAHFIARAVEEICRLAGAMGGLDTVVFSGGIGENAADIRQAIAEGLAFLPGHDGRGVDVLVCPADEERRILTATEQVLKPVAGGSRPAR
ncbi:acetate kinase [Marivita sp.]|uniref:acetate/propionate family kinase n=1 Tax=Marivita sp. TaxID=2003365 RepID=UPI0025C6B2FE|nr:acetate kinase [Marivita sp.]